MSDDRWRPPRSVFEGKYDATSVVVTLGECCDCLIARLAADMIFSEFFDPPRRPTLSSSIHSTQTSRCSYGALVQQPTFNLTGQIIARNMPERITYTYMHTIANNTNSLWHWRSTTASSLASSSSQLSRSGVDCTSGLSSSPTMESFPILSVSSSSTSRSQPTCWGKSSTPPGGAS